MGSEVGFDTYTAGLATGQLLTVDLPEHSYSGDLLITELSLQELVPAYGAQPASYGYRVKAVSGEAVGGWIEFFRRWDRDPSIGNLVEGAPETVVIALDMFLKVWIESEHPNPFYRLYPATDLYPNSNLYPQFEPYYEIKYLSLYDGIDNEVARKAITSISVYTPIEIRTITLVGPADYVGDITHLGWWGGAAATATLGTGILLDKVALATTLTKSILEGLLITRRDLKGWGPGTGGIDTRAITSAGFWTDVGPEWGVFPGLQTSSGDWPLQQEV